MAVLVRHGTRLGLPGRMPMLLALVFCIALAGLLLVRSAADSSARPSHDAAVDAALDDPIVRAYLAGEGYDRVVTGRLDDRNTRVAFFDGSRIVLEAAVPARGELIGRIRWEAGRARMGSEVGQSAPALAALLFLFALATLRLPLGRIENLDAAAMAAFVVPVALLNNSYLEWGVLVATALLAYLAVRCVSVAANRPGGRPAKFVFETAPRSVRRLCVGAAVLVLLCLSIPGGLASDVAYASMAGATKVLDGTLPYGPPFTPELIHGDTYPLLAYLAYLPGAVIAPVRSGFDSMEGGLVVASAFALIGAGALGVAVRRAGGNGARAALAMLAFPPVMIATSSGANDAVAAALVALALAVGSTAALTAAGWVKLAPLALVPLWVVAARRRGVALVGASLVTAAVGVVLVAIGGPGGLADMLHAMSFQAERGSLLSPWWVLGAGGVQVVFQAAVIAGIAWACLRVWHDRVLAADPRRMAALGAAILLAVQLAANYWNYTYLAWVFPLIALALLSGEREPARA